MTDNEIIKALECCIGRVKCKKCPMFGKCAEDTWSVEKYALDLINRLQAEKDKAWELFKKKSDETIELQMLCDKQKAEIERLQNERIERIRELTKVVYDKEIAEAKAEAIKEFAEKLPEIIPHFDDGHTTMECVVRAVKNLVKEMVGE